jgi:hypothetical protein
MIRYNDGRQAGAKIEVTEDAFCSAVAEAVTAYFAEGTSHTGAQSAGPAIALLAWDQLTGVRG